MSTSSGAVPADNVRTLAKTLRVLADPRRLRILDLLMEGVQCNCEIAGRLGMSLSLISHHMRVLREARLVRGERDPEDARWIYYSVDQQVLARLNDQLGHLLDVRRIQPRVPACGPKRANRC